MNTKIIEKIKSDEILNKIESNFDNEIYLVGGAVRDFALAKETFDRDLIVTDEDARIFSEKLAELFDASFVSLDEENKIYRLVLKDKINYIDVTSPIENSMKADLQRRDLTINAIAVNLSTYEILDPYNGLDDIKNNCINFIKEENFIDDPLRLLRVFRFEALLGYKIAPELMEIVKRHKNLISEPAVERVSYEIVKLFGGKYAHTALLDMDETGLLEWIFPIINDLKKVPSNSHHHLDLFHHSIETVRQIQIIYENASADVKKHLETIDFGGQPRLNHLKLVGFLHDIGKFSTWTIEEDKHRFIKHDDVGSKMVVKVLKKLNFSNKQIDYIAKMIKYHIYPSHLMCSPEITDKIMMRFVRRMDANAIDNIIIAQADRYSARGVEITEEIVEKNISSLNRLLNFYLEKRDGLEPLPKLIDGNEVMRILNIKPSPKLGEIMDALHEAQLNGDVCDKTQAEDFIKDYVDNRL